MSTPDQRVNLAALRKRPLYRGYKTYAKDLAIKVRRANGFSDLDRLDCPTLAENLGLHVFHLSSYGPSPHVDQLTVVDPSCFSAATVPRGDRIAILLNDSHSPERQASNLAHELSHVLLDHDDAPWLNETGCREIHADVEAEAEYMGSVLLVTDAAAIRAFRRGQTVTEAAAELGVSEALMRWRINDSGAAKRTSRAGARAFPVQRARSRG